VFAREKGILVLGHVFLKATFKLDATKEPKTID
jgi:hypothetical protein